MNETTTAPPENAFLDLEFPVEVWLALERIPPERLLRLETGGILKLSKEPDAPVDLVVNGSIVATGELVVVEGNFGFRVTGTAQQRLASLESGESVLGGLSDPGNGNGGSCVPKATRR